jgi:hypothetical protein
MPLKHSEFQSEIQTSHLTTLCLTCTDRDPEQNQKKSLTRVVKYLEVKSTAPKMQGPQLTYLMTVEVVSSWSPLLERSQILFNCLISRTKNHQKEDHNVLIISLLPFAHIIVLYVIFQNIPPT